MFSKFALGMLVATAITTKEGREVAKKMAHVGNKIAKKYYKIDVMELLNEADEEEKREDENNG